jgi:hypothetical protein
METIDKLLERRLELIEELNDAQSDWYKQIIDSLIFNLDLELKKLTKNNLE